LPGSLYGRATIFRTSKPKRFDFIFLISWMYICVILFRTSTDSRRHARGTIQTGVTGFFFQPFFVQILGPIDGCSPRHSGQRLIVLRFMLVLELFPPTYPVVRRRQYLYFWSIFDTRQLKGAAPGERPGIQVDCVDFRQAKTLRFPPPPFFLFLFFLFFSPYSFFLSPFPLPSPPPFPLLLSPFPLFFSSSLIFSFLSSGDED